VDAIKAKRLLKKGENFHWGEFAKIAGNYLKKNF